MVREDRRAFKGLKLEEIKGDIMEPESLNKAFKNVDIVYHLAAYISLLKKEKDTINKINIMGTRNVVQACLSCDVRRLIHFSSIHALESDPRSEVIDETRPLALQNKKMAYDQAKARAELEVLSALDKGLEVVIVNPTGIIGPYDFKPSLLGEMLLLIVQNKLPALINGGFNWVDVRDVVKGAIAAAEYGQNGERYILSGTWLSIADLFSLIHEITGCKITRVVVPIWLAYLGVPFLGVLAKIKGKKPIYTRASLYSLMNHRFITNKKAIKQLGYKSRPLRETIIDTYNWFKENNFFYEI